MHGRSNNFIQNFGGLGIGYFSVDWEVLYSTGLE